MSAQFYRGQVVERIGPNDHPLMDKLYPVGSKHIVKRVLRKGETVPGGYMGEDALLLEGIPDCGGQRSSEGYGHCPEKFRPLDGDDYATMESRPVRADRKNPVTA